MLRCPNCRARLNGGEHCRRCGMELTRLLETQRAAQRWLMEALNRLEAGNASGAIAALEHSRTLYREPFSDLLLGFARSLAEDPDSGGGPAP
ncbi:MAG TPA: hypothetical protein VK965_07985 [Halomonas sp.]|nr:hypothetical protein [Halomonas sp.]